MTFAILYTCTTQSSIVECFLASWCCPLVEGFLSCTIYIMCCHGRRLYGSCWFFSIGFSLTRILLCFHGFLSIGVHSDYNIVETLHGLEIGKDAHVHIVQICLCIKLNACERISILIYTYMYKMLRQILRHIRPCGTSKATHQINQVPAECRLIHGALSFHCHHAYMQPTHVASRRRPPCKHCTKTGSERSTCRLIVAVGPRFMNE